MSRKTYSGESINVSFDPDLCQHAAECVRGLPDVFEVKRRPWIIVDNADPEKVAEIVDRCPSKALLYEWVDSEPEAA